MKHFHLHDAFDDDDDHDGEADDFHYPQAVVFEMAGQVYAIEASMVQETMGFDGGVPVPGNLTQPVFLKALRNETVCTFHLASLLGLADSLPSVWPSKASVLITESSQADIQVGWIVDRILGMISLQLRRMIPVGESVTTAAHLAAEVPVIGQFQQGKRRITLLDIEKILCKNNLVEIARPGEKPVVTPIPTVEESKDV